MKIIQLPFSLILAFLDRGLYATRRWLVRLPLITHGDGDRDLLNDTDGIHHGDSANGLLS